MQPAIFLKSHIRRAHCVLAMVLLTITIPASAQVADDWQTLGLLRVRDMTPFGLNRLDMLPAHAVAATPGTFAFEFNLTYQNTWALSDNVLEYLESRPPGRRELTSADIDNILALPGDAYLVDGEFGLVDLTLHYRVNRHWGTYVTIPYYVFNDGVLDGTVENFHDLFGFSNAGRKDVPRHRWQAIAKLDGTSVVQTGRPSNDLGDPVLGLRYSLRERPGRWNLIAEAAVKIPRADDELLVSTGETDYGIQLSYQRFYAHHALYATLAGVYFGEPDTMPGEDQIIPTLILGWEARVSRHLNTVLQLYGSRSTVQNTSLDELSAEKLEATLGVQWLYRGNVLRLGLTENIAHFNNTPDIGITLSFAHVFHRE